jgi:hypothetical protein
MLLIWYFILLSLLDMDVHLDYQFNLCNINYGVYSLKIISFESIQAEIVYGIYCYNIYFMLNWSN